MSIKLILLENQYIEAKDAYYAGEPIMTDSEFDILEEELVKMGSDIVRKVGHLDTTQLKYSHPSPMLSLSKKKTDDNTKPPTIDVMSWFKKVGNYTYEISPKYDGNAVNLIYNNGKLIRALTRGNGIKGRDVTDKIKLKLPQKINTNLQIEIRGEVVMNVQTFKKKYSEYENPRNLVAGILGRNDVDINICKDIDFIPFEIKTHTENGVIYNLEVEQFLTENKFPYLPYRRFVSNITQTKFEKLFYYFLDYRENISKYQLDGFVIKVFDSKRRVQLGENNHDPEWAVAVKYQSVEEETILNDIEWNIGKTGEFCPVGLLEPVYVDGSTVKRVTLNNLGYIIKNKLYPGAKIGIIKSGDIIPKITRVYKESPLTKDEFLKKIPQVCSICGEPTHIEDIHLVCSNNSCSGKLFRIFKYGIKTLKIDFFGNKTAEKIFDNGITNVIDLLDETKFNKVFLLRAGFPDGKNIDKMLYQINKIQSLPLESIIILLAIPNLGETAAKQVAKMYAGINYSKKGFQKEFFKICENQDILAPLINKIQSLGIKVVYPVEDNKNLQTYEMTGSPKNAGFKTKDEFTDFAEKAGFGHDKLSKNSKYLITDSYTSSSSKMGKAKKLNVSVITYQDFFDKYK